jgi:hypothetical protein
MVYKNSKSFIISCKDYRRHNNYDCEIGTEGSKRTKFESKMKYAEKKRVLMKDITVTSMLSKIKIIK